MSEPFQFRLHPVRVPTLPVWVLERDGSGLWSIYQSGGGFAPGILYKYCTPNQIASAIAKAGPRKWNPSLPRGHELDAPYWNAVRSETDGFLYPISTMYKFRTIGLDHQCSPFHASHMNYWESNPYLRRYSDLPTGCNEIVRFAGPRVFEPDEVIAYLHTPRVMMWRGYLRRAGNVGHARMCVGETRVVPEFESHEREISRQLIHVVPTGIWRIVRNYLAQYAFTWRALCELFDSALAGGQPRCTAAKFGLFTQFDFTNCRLERCGDDTLVQFTYDDD